MRLLHTLASPFFTGPAEAVLQLARAQREQGHQVAVAVDRLRRRHTSEELAVPRFEAEGLLLPEALELSVKSSPRGLWRDARALRRLGPEVVHCHFSHDHLLVRLARPAGAALVRSIHAPRSLRWSTPAADAWTVPTEALARRLPGAPVLVLPPLVDRTFVPAGDPADLRRALGVEGVPVVGMVSTFQPSRRHQLGLEAFGRLLRTRPGARLVLVGDGPLEGALRATVAAGPLAPRVRFAGYQAGADFVRWLQALDQVWILGLGNDFAGRAAAQARACGVRVLAVDEGALARWADQVVPADAAALAAAAEAPGRREVPVPTPAEVAAQVEGLYRQARARRGGD